MDPVDMIWRGVALPTLSSALLLSLAVRPWRDSSASPGAPRLAAAPAAVASGYALSHLALSNWSWPGLPPVDTTQWPLFLAGGALVLSLFEIWRKPAPLARWILRTLLLAASVTLVALPHWSAAASSAAGALPLLALTAGSAAWWALMEGAAARLPRAAFLAALIGVLSGASIALVICGTGLVAQLTGALAAAAGPLLILTLWRPAIPVDRLALPVAAVLLTVLWANGLLYTYADLSGISVLLLVSALLTFGTAWFPARRRLGQSPSRLKQLIAASLPFLAALIPLAAAVAVALAHSAPMEY